MVAKALSQNNIVPVAFSCNAMETGGTINKFLAPIQKVAHSYDCTVWGVYNIHVTSFTIGIYWIWKPAAVIANHKLVLVWNSKRGCKFSISTMNVYLKQSAISILLSGRYYALLLSKSNWNVNFENLQVAVVIGNTIHFWRCHLRDYLTPLLPTCFLYV